MTPERDEGYRLLIVGPQRHGVVIHAEQLARHCPGARTVRLSQTAPGATAVLSALSGEHTPAHLHVTDRILGSDPAHAADLVETIARAVPLTVTLHDLPQPSDGEFNYPRRRAAYLRIARAVRGVQVSSSHEKALLDEIVTDDEPLAAPVSVVPLPVQRRVEPIRPGPVHRSVGVLGYLYPGKGHLETLAAMGSIDPGVEFVALGAPSPGHDHLITDVSDAAGRQRRSATVTGYLDDEALDAAVARLGVPVAAHSHISASGSINRWIECGRRPIVVVGRYARELRDRMPWALTVVDRHELGESIAAALADPRSTWIDEARWSPAEAPDAATSARAQCAAIEAALDIGSQTQIGIVAR